MQWNDLGNVDEEFDMGWWDYEDIYSEVEQMCPSMKPMVEWIRSQRPARLGEFDYCLKHLHEGFEEEQSNLMERILEMSARVALKNALHAYKKDGLDLEDAFQAACLGIVRAAWRYDPDIKTPFPTYRSRWMLDAMQKEEPYYQPSCKYPPDSVQHVKKIISDLKPGIDYCDILSLDPEELYKLLIENTSCDEEEATQLSYLLLPAESIETLLEDGQDDLFSDNGEKVKQIDDSLLIDEIRDKIDNLEDEEKKVIEMRYGFYGYRAMTRREIGWKMGFTIEHVRQIEMKAIRHLLRHGHLSGLEDRI